MKDINLVLRNKRVQLAELTLEISGLEAATAALRPVVHLLADEEPPMGRAAALPSITLDGHPSPVTDEARAVGAERSRVRRWV